MEATNLSNFEHRIGDVMNDGLEVNLHAANSNILSMDEMRAERAKQQFNALTQEAFRAVKLIERQNAGSETVIKFPTDPVEASHFSGERMDWLREQELNGLLVGDFGNNKWMDEHEKVKAA